MDKIKPSEVSEVLLQQLNSLGNEQNFDEVGTVLTVSDGVARIYGLRNAEANELLEFESDLATWTGIEMDNVFVDSEVEYSVGLIGETRVKITVKFLSDVTLDDGADLTIEIAAEDTSGNLSEVFTVVPEVPENP